MARPNSQRPRSAARESAARESAARESAAAAAAGAAPPPAWPSLAVGAAAFLAYALLAPPVAADKDTGEFTLVLATLGLAHPTGYGLYTLFGHAFVVAAHAAGLSWARAANTFSALGGGVAMGAMHALAARLWPGRVAPRTAAALALLPAAAFAMNPLWTMETTLAEVNSWHVAWAAGVTLLTWDAALALADATAPAARTKRAAMAWGLVAGAGLAHHTTAVLFGLPASVLLVVLAVRRGRDGVLAALAALGCAALPVALSVGWVAFRAWHPGEVQWPEITASWPAVVAHVTGAQYRSFLGRWQPSAGQATLLGLYVHPWLVLAVPGALAAPFVPSPASRPVRIAFAAAVLLQTAFCFVYGVPDPSSYFMPALLLGLVLAAVAIAALPAVRRAAAVTVTIAALALGAVVVDGARVAVRRDTAFVNLDVLLRRMWGSIPPGPGFVIWNDDMTTRLRIYQQLEGERPELTVVNCAHLTHPAPRARFVARFGFDPAAGIEPLLVGTLTAADTTRARRIREGIEERINSGTRLPVFLFMPEVPSLRQMRKPATAAAAARP